MGVRVYVVCSKKEYMTCVTKSTLSIYICVDVYMRGHLFHFWLIDFNYGIRTSRCQKPTRQMKRQTSHSTLTIGGTVFFGHILKAGRLKEKTNLVSIIFWGKKGCPEKNHNQQQTHST